MRNQRDARMELHTNVQTNLILMRKQPRNETFAKKETL